MQDASIEGFRLSPQQKRLWQLQELGNSQAYRAHCAVLIEGNLNLEILKSALQNVIHKHEILRTTFQVLEGMNLPLQVIGDRSLSTSLHINFLDEKNINIELQLQKAIKQPFSWQNSLGLEISLVLLSPAKAVLFIGLPALLADKVTLNNLVCEISRSYVACLQNEHLSDEPLQYADIAEWQNELFESEEGKIAREYWQNQKKKILTNYHLPLENKPTLEPEFTPTFIALEFNPDTVAKLDAIAKNYNSSIPIFLQACWCVLISRLTGESDVVIGTYCEGRNYEELTSALGLLAKYLPISSSLEQTLKFSEILKQTHEAIEETFKWQESFAWEKNENFFPIAFEFEEQPTKYVAADISFSINKQYLCIDRFKVKLSCIHRDDALIAQFHYDANLFQVEDISRLARQFQTLLESAINQPEAAIGELEILSANEQHQLLIEFNNTQTEYPKHQCIHQLFEDWAAKTPEQIAVVFEDQKLTYAQLNARANQLAHHLQALGVGCETIVALCIDRSWEMLVGLLGIIKAGGAYLPLDPILPDERLAFMVEDAGASVILTQQHFVERFSKPSTTVICLDSNWEEIARQSEENLHSDITPENLIYVIYTSGSTGKPKGVAVEHQQLLNYLYGILARLKLPIGSSFATVSTIAADLGNTAIFPALCTGGCLHVISQERATNAEALAEYCDRHAIDCLKIVPSHLKALLSASHPEKIMPRKRLILGGEAVSWQLVEQLQQYAPNCQILNHYGPTEATVGVLTYLIESREHSETVPLGRAIANTQIYILNHHLRPVPIGVAGELYIGGDSLARGYLNQPELTRDRFIRNPFSSIQNSYSERLYKTGDLARYLPDGNIEFLGRIDNQVKIHGFRIELSEIESVLNEHPDIRETVVLAREDEPGNKRLVAYVVPKQPSEFLVSELRNFLKQKLPEYMVPLAFVRLKALPLTPNGKVDRQALPAPDSMRPELEGQFVAPRTPVEETIAGIWMQVLGLDRVGIYDNFFELGGDSIMSIQIVARLNQAGLQLTPKQMFEYPTVAGLAAVAGTALTMRSHQEPVTGSLPLTPIQHWFFEQKLCDRHHWNQAVLLEVQQAMVPDLLKQAMQHLLKHHDALRLRFTTTESGWQQVNAGFDEAEAVPFSSVDLSSTPAAERETALEAIATQIQASLNLTNGPLMRVVLFNLGDTEPNRLFIVIHHLAVDGISWRILLEDFQQVYHQLSQGETVELPPKTTSFKQWSEFLQEYAQSTELQQERDYWVSVSRQSVSPLPVDNPGGANAIAFAGKVSVSLGVEETRALLQEVPAAYRTEINDVLLTALVQVFAQWTKEQSLLVDLEGHGREAIAQDIDLSRTVGWFTTIFPVVLTLEGILEPGEALKAIKEQLRSIPNRGIGYGVLRYLSKDAQLQTLPQAEVRFNYLGQFDQVLPESSLFKRVNQTPGVSRSVAGDRRYLLDINGFVLGGQLQLEWTYSEEIHQRTTIERLARGYLETLRSLITHCQSPEAGGYTPSDFPKAQLSQNDLNKLLSKLNTTSEKKSR
jgi:amino acid adenylation domain-containing protein/non-ribosomal peptide synthase protein (TIGR01720 family)